MQGIKTSIPFIQRLDFRIVALFTLVLLIGSAVGIYGVRYFAEKDFRALLDDKFRTASDVSENIFNQTGQMAMIWANHFTLHEELQAAVQSGDQQKISHWMKQLKSEATADIVVLLDREGKIRFHSEDSRNIGNSLLSLELARKSIRDRKQISSIVQEIDNFIIYSSGIMLKDASSKEIDAVVLVGYSINDRLIENISHNTNVGISIIRRRAVMASTFNESGKRLQTIPLPWVTYQIMLANPSMINKFKLNNVSYFARAKRLELMEPSQEGSILITFPTERLDEVKDEHTFRLTLLFVAQFLIIAILGWRFSHKLIKPLRQLVDYTTQVTSGEEAKPFGVNTRDEVGFLTNHVNVLITTIDEKKRELDQYNRTLELKVKRKTEDLEAVNSALLLEQKRLSDAQHIAKIGNWSLDFESNQLTWSRELFHILDVNPEQTKASLDTLLSVVHPDDQEKVSQVHSESIRNRKGFVLAYRLQLSNNSIRYIRERADLLLDSSSHSISMLGTVQDISDQYEQERILRSAQKMEAIGKLSGGLAHDFNNQLAIVKGYLDFLADFIGDVEKPRRWLDNASEATDRCIQLAQKLRSISRSHPVGAHEIDPRVVVTELREIIEKSITPSINPHFEIEDELWPVKVNRDELENALLNSVINARESMPEGGHLTVTVKPITMDYEQSSREMIKAGDYIQFSVSDTGEGMSQEVMEHAFEPFFSTKEFGQGSGMGLSMVYGLAKQAGGTATIYSEEGHGTTVNIYIPRLTRENSRNE